MPLYTFIFPLEMQEAKSVSYKASRTKAYGQGNLFNTQWRYTARFCLTLEKFLPYYHAAITG